MGSWTPPSPDLNGLNIDHLGCLECHLGASSKNNQIHHQSKRNIIRTQPNSEWLFPIRKIIANGPFGSCAPWRLRIIIFNKKTKLLLPWAASRPLRLLVLLLCDAQGVHLLKEIMNFNKKTKLSSRHWPKQKPRCLWRHPCIHMYNYTSIHVPP